MLLPFQQYRFTAPPPLKELKRKMELMAAEMHPERRMRSLFRKKTTSGTPKYLFAWDNGNATITTLKPDGAEDSVRVIAEISPDGLPIEVVVKLQFTTAWLTNIALSLILAFAAGNIWLAITDALPGIYTANAAIAYVALAAAATYINIKQYHAKSTRLIEEMIYWLELSETEQ